MKRKYAVLSLPVPSEGVVKINDRELARRLAKALGRKWPAPSIRERAEMHSLAEIATQYFEERCERAKVHYA